VTINGAQKPAVRVQADPAALAGAGLTLETCAAALAAEQRQPAQGQPRRPAPGFHPGHQRQLAKAASFRP